MTASLNGQQGVSLGSASATYALALPDGKKKAITVTLSVQDAA